MCHENIEWNRNSNDIAIIARCRKWQAELAMKEPYAPGLILLKPKDKCESFPNKLGDGIIDGREDLFELIHEITARMRNHLTCTVHGKECRCENVYLLSLNENDGKSDLHFRLWPKYNHDTYLMEQVDETGEEADPIALMAERRHQFLIRQSTNRWGSWPPSQESNIEAWNQYAQNIRQMIIPKKQSDQSNNNNDDE